MKDQYQRDIHYMRISITDRCNYRCSYCKGYEHLKHNNILSYEEILEICQASLHLGIDTFKVTGGEPCVRKGYLSFIKNLKELDGVKKVTLTTNGSLFSFEDLDFLKQIGLDGMNVSIDSLKEEHYNQITGKNDLKKVIENVLYAKQIGLFIKINVVLLDELENEEILELIHFGKNHDIPIRFIELMPMKDNCRGHRTKEDVIKLLHDVKKDDTIYGNGPASYYRCEEGIVGFIEPIHGKFCNTCNRVRLTSTGYLKTCLFHSDGRNIRHLENIEEIMKELIYHKPKAHNFEEKMVGISMSQIGG